MRSSRKWAALPVGRAHEGDRDHDECSLAGLVAGVAGVVRRRPHPRVVGQRPYVETLDAPLLREGSELLQHLRSHAVSLTVVAHDQHHVGVVAGAARSLVARDRDDLVVLERDESFAPVVIEHGEPIELTVRQPRVRRQEPLALGLARQLLVERAQRRAIGTVYGPYDNHRTMIPQEATR